MNIFEGHINGNIPVIVDFSAPWCNTGQMMDAVLHEVKETAGEKVTVLKIDIDKEPGFKELYDIKTVPTLILFKKGNILWRKAGIAPAHEILDHINIAMAI
jgi:thioredoxin 1